MPRSDIFQSLRPRHVTVTAFECDWPILLDTAISWIGAVGFDLDTLAGVFPGALGDDRIEEMQQQALRHPDADRRWVNAARVAVSRGGGRDWWWTVNLVRKSLQAWPYINGKLLLSGVDAHTARFPDWLDATFMMLWSNADEKDRIKLELELSLPPAGAAVKRSPAAKRRMLAEFAAD